jgi:hypothetical protein
VLPQYISHSSHCGWLHSMFVCILKDAGQLVHLIVTVAVVRLEASHLHSASAATITVPGTIVHMILDIHYTVL